jgi:hypothetical protein
MQASNTAINSLRPPVARVKSLRSSKIGVRCTVYLSKLTLTGRFPNKRQVPGSIMVPTQPLSPLPELRIIDSATQHTFVCVTGPGSITTRKCHTLLSMRLQLDRAEETTVPVSAQERFLADEIPVTRVCLYNTDECVNKKDTSLRRRIVMGYRYRTVP